MNHTLLRYLHVFLLFDLLIVPSVDAFITLSTVLGTKVNQWNGAGLSAWSVDAQGHVCFVANGGERIKGSGQPMITTGDSRQHVGSITKSMTATLMAILIQDGLIENGWDATMMDLLPDLAGGTVYADITLSELLGMMAGIEDPAELQPVLAANPDLAADLNISDVRSIRRFATGAAFRTVPVIEPGSGFLYSSWSYIVAGHIIELLTDMVWEDVLAARLFRPLGIDLGTDPLGYTGAATGSANAWGHTRTKSNITLIPCDPEGEVCDNAAFVGPSGTFSGPVAAMAAYFSWHIRCHKGISGTGGDELLTQEACQKMHQPADASVSPYGYGWFCNESRDRGLVCTHNGSNGLNQYMTSISFAQERVFVTFANSGSYATDWDSEMASDAMSVVTALGNQSTCSAPFESSVYAAERTSGSAESQHFSRQVDLEVPFTIEGKNFTPGFYPEKTPLVILEEDWTTLADPTACSRGSIGSTYKEGDGVRSAAVFNGADGPFLAVAVAFASSCIAVF